MRVVACSVPVKVPEVFEIKINGEVELVGLGESVDMGIREKETQKMNPRNYARLF